MITEAILKPIGNWQYTLPQSWRIAWWFNKKHVRAKFKNKKIIIEALDKENEDLDWDIKKISLNKLNEETVEAIKESKENYRKWNKDAFKSHEDFWKDV